MKTFKLAIIALILACSFQVSTANAQVRVGVRIGTPPPRHRVVVVDRRPYYHRRAVVYRPGYRRYYGRPYHRPYRERVVVRRRY